MSSDDAADRRAAEERAPPEGAVPLDADAESGKQAFMQALEVPRNARRGALAGAGFAAAVFVLFVAIPGADRSPLWYLALGFVLAVSTAGFVTFVLTLLRAYRLSRDL